MKNNLSFSNLSGNTLPKIAGVTIGVTHCGLKKKSKDDLVLILFEESSPIYGCFTKSKTPGESVKWNKSIIKFGKVSAILINSGNANVFNGKKGELSQKKIINALSKIINVKPREIYIASTGVIGELLDEKKVISRLPFLVKNQTNTQSKWKQAAMAIGTTDKIEKFNGKVFELGNKRISIKGIAKGSGMIAPNMATMLAFIFTDANFIKSKPVKKFFLDAVDKTFNSITIDGDTSTSDMVLMVAVKKQSNHMSISKRKELNEFSINLEDVMRNLAHKIVKDGEGAKKFINIEVSNATTNKAAKLIAMSIANSPLFKTAMAGEDSNWGRIIMAIGKSGAMIEPEKLSISFANYEIIKYGELSKKVNFKKLDKYLKNKKLHLLVNIGLGKGFSRVWTCDFTKDYIKINADYRS